MAGRSRWFVGSSRTRRLTSFATSSASNARVRSPGDNVVVGRVTSSAPRAVPGVVGGGCRGRGAGGGGGGGGRRGGGGWGGAGRGGRAGGRAGAAAAPPAAGAGAPARPAAVPNCDSGMSPCVVASFVV